jgi:hypothetical protein
MLVNVEAHLIGHLVQAAAARARNKRHVVRSDARCLVVEGPWRGARRGQCIDVSILFSFTRLTQQEETLKTSPSLARLHRPPAKSAAGCDVRLGRTASVAARPRTVASI